MAFCANCGTEMSDQAAACPKCGHPTFTPRAVRRTEGSAVAALVLGVLGIVACPLVLSIPAVIVGTQAKARIAADPSLDGEPLARVGVILGWVGIGLAALGVLIFVLVFAFGSRTVGPTF